MAVPRQAAGLPLFVRGSENERIGTTLERAKLRGEDKFGQNTVQILFVFLPDTGEFPAAL